MEYLDFSSVITLIRKYINDERTVEDKLLKQEVKIDQIHLLDLVFASFCGDTDSPDYTFDNGQVVAGSMDRKESVLELFPIIWMKKTGLSFLLILNTMCYH